MGAKDLFIKKKVEPKAKAGPPPGSSWAAQVGTGTVPGAPPRSYLDSGTRRSQAAAKATTVAGPTEVDPEFTTEIEEQLKAVPAPKGFDVFLGALESLNKFVPDEGNRFKAAMEMTASSGLTSKQISETLRSRLQTLQQILASFQKELKEEAEASTAEREQQLKGLAAQIEDLQSQINALQKEKQGLSEDERELQEKNLQMEQQKAQVTNRYTGAHSSITTKTQELLDKVLRYLGQ
jgi:uncharacterized phage infection (PIP) family protein YhgE